MVRGTAALFAIGAFLVLGTAAETATKDANPIVVENQQPGTTSWQFTNYNKESAHEIEGYASLTSVNKGAPINFMVSLSSSAQYTMDFYRMGWYPTGTNPDGTSCAPSCGGRLMLHVGPLNGAKQAACPRVTTSTSQDFGLTECAWTPSYTLNVPTSWTTGNYIVKLTRLDGTKLENWMTFVVRDDSSTAPVVYSMDVNTWQAYNFWGGSGNSNLGINLYGRLNDVTLANVSGSRAYTVSFNRPYLDQGSLDGAGNFMVWDFPLIRWMESQGYDISYITDVDLEANPNVLNGHSVFVNTGHDEYYSDGMRARIENGIASGVNMAFFGANNIYHRTTWGSDSAGAPLRRVHTDKGALSGSTTVEWRFLQPPKPENAVLGVMENGVATARPFLISDASSWIYSGTGLVNYTGNGTTGVVTSGPGQNALPGLVGYEFDTRAVNGQLLTSFTSAEPAGLTQVGHSFVPSADNGVNAWADATVYTAGSGATVFSAGTIQWAFAVDNGYNDGFCNCDHAVANAVGKKITTNIIDRFTASNATPAANVSPSSLTFASQITGTTSAAQSATLTNTGSGALTISSIALAGTNAGDYTQSNTCPISPSTLAAGAACTISVSFAPTATGSRTASVSITDDAAGSPHSLSLSGTGTAPSPAVNLTPSSLDFGAQLVSTTSDAKAATLTNTGTGPLTISSIAIAGAGAAAYAQTNTCPTGPSTLAVNASCTISVTFAPTATGARAATLAITDDATGSPHAVSLSGTGVMPGVNLTPAGLDFGPQLVNTTSSAKTATLTNTGTAPLTISNIVIGGADAAAYAQTNTCPAGPSTLAVNASCTISVTFTPTALGARTATLTITDDASGSPRDVSLTGTGTAPAPAVSLTPSSLGFGSQLVNTTSSAKTTTLTNTGTAPLTISGVAIAGPNAGDYTQTSTCPLAPSTLPAGASCTISVRFAPTASGNRTATVTIDDDAGDSPQSLSLSGTGTTPAPAVSLTPSSLDFGSQPVNTTSNAKTVTLTNTGTAPLTVTSIGIAGAGAAAYAETDTCPSGVSTLAATASCTISVTFTPTAADVQAATVTIADNAADSPQAVDLTGTGTSPAATLTPGTLAFGSQVVGTSAMQPTTLSNSGTGTLTITSIAITGANAADYSKTTDCPASLAAGSSCTISVTFAPSAPGSRVASVTIADNAAGSPHAVGLSGTGVAAAPAVTLTPTGLTFSSQLINTTSAAQATTLQNTGTGPLTISSIAVAGANAGEYAQSNNCPIAPATLAVNATCSISVTFTPTGVGTRTATVTIADNAPGSPQSVSLTGTGAAAQPAVALAPASIAFGDQQIGTASAASTATLQNTGAGSLSISGITLGGTNAGDFSRTTTCGATLAPGASCTISVTFTPAAAGSRTASLSVGDNAAGSPHTVALSGTGVFFVDGFETGTLAKWSTSGTGSAAAQTATAHLGTFAAALTATTKQTITTSASLGGGAQTLTYTRLYYRFTSVAGAAPIAYGTDVGGNQEWEIDSAQGGKRLTLLVWTSAGKQTSFNFNTTLAANTWYSIELRLDQLQAGYAELWVNGTSAGSTRPLNLSTASPYAKLVLANVNGGGTQYYDDVIVSSTYTGP